jgi:hypothetical protein
VESQYADVQNDAVFLYPGEAIEVFAGVQDVRLLLEIAV